MIYENEALILVVLEGRTLLWQQNSSENVSYTFARLYTKFQFLNHLWEEVVTENLQNKKKFEKSQKKEEGGDAKLVHFFFFFSLGLIVSKSVL